MTPVKTRFLTPDDAERFREMRLKTIEYYGELLSELYRQEAARPGIYWKNQLAQQPDKGWIGAFAGTELVGMNAFRRYTGARRMALGWGNFVLHDFRNKGYGEALYRRRMEEIAARGYDNGLVVYLLDGKRRPLEILLKQGAQWMFDRRMASAGGPPFLTHWYRVPLPPQAARAG